MMEMKVRLGLKNYRSGRVNFEFSKSVIGSKVEVLLSAESIAVGQLRKL